MIGIFDSGIGGLSVFREIRKVLPEQSYVYYSDNAHCPYGEKTREYIIDRAPGEGLIKFGSTVVPFENHFPRDSKMYAIMNTRLTERDAK